MMALIIAFLFSSALCCGIYAIRNIGHTVPRDDRRYKDPLPLKMRMVWPIVNFFAYYVGRFLSVEYLQKSKQTLQKAELIYLMEPEQLFGMQLLSALLMGLGSFLIFNLIDYDNLLLCFGIACLGYFMPFISAHERRKMREKEIVRSLPIYLDFIVMAIEAGMNLNGAMQQAVAKGPSGPMANELNTVLRDIRAGMSRAEAMRLMADRLSIKEINNLVSALVQAQKTGASVADTLRVQSNQRRAERFQKAEKLALEAPVKLVFPLVAFIFPCTFVVIFFPIILKFIAEV